jgi:hypothetical protein
VSTLTSRMASAGGSVCTPPVEPETTDTPSTVNSLFSVGLLSIESWLALAPVASPPDEAPAVRDSRFRILRLGSGRSYTWDMALRQASISKIALKLSKESKLRAAMRRVLIEL